MNIKVVKSNLTNVLLILVFLKFFISCKEKQPDLIYILEWTSADDSAYGYLEMGQDAFISRNCLFQNCFLTKDQFYFDNFLDFDVLLFNVVGLLNDVFPPIRSESQLYVLVGLEPLAYHSVNVPEKYDTIFNMTWSYKLNADIVFPYIVVRNKQGIVIGPKKDMHWEYEIKDMVPTAKDIIGKLQSKSIAAAVIVSHCNTNNDRQSFIERLNTKLQQYNKEVHIYGNCGYYAYECYRKPEDRNGIISGCASKIESDYYFYLALENSSSDDYVSEKVLHGLNHFAVPVVLGGANYTRFMPDGIYLNAKTLGVKALAKEMNDIINDKKRYIDFFKWHGYYSYYDTYDLESLDTYVVCNLCAKLNKRIKSKQKSRYRSIVKWGSN